MNLTAIISLILTGAIIVFDCASAFTHKHDRLKDAEVDISSWNGCSMVGTINGVSTSLFMDVATCPLHAKVPGRFRIRYDQSCGAVLEITDGPIITTPMPPSCPVQTPTPSPSPTPGGTLIGINGRVIDDKDQSIAGALVSAFNKTVLSRAGDGYFEFTGIPVGSTVTATKAGFTFNTETVRLGVPEQMYFIRGKAVAQPSPSPTPTPKPSPTPTPTPVPTPLPSPTPTPTPTPARVYVLTLSTDPVVREKQINDEEKITGVKLINCDGNLCYFARRP